MEWWIWAVAGLALLGLEVASGTFYFVFFAFGALVVGLVRIVGIADPLWMQVLLFAVLSVVSIFLFRRPLFDRIRGSGLDEGVDDIRRETAVAVAAIEAGATGKAELRGVPWSARNVGEQTIDTGVECTIEKVDGLTLLLRAR